MSQEKLVGYILKQVQSMLRARMDGVLEAQGLTTPQYAVLLVLEEHPGISNADLARRTFVTPQTMIRILQNLEERGLIERVPHPHHGRVLQVRLSAKGKSAVAGSHDRVLAIEEQMLSRLSRSDRKHLLELLKSCIEGLKEGDEEKP